MQHSRWLLVSLCTFLPAMAMAQGAPSTKAPTGFTIRLDAPEEPTATPESKGEADKAAVPTGKTIFPAKAKKRPRKSAKQRRAEKRKAKAAKRKARKAAQRKAKRAKRKARKARITKKKARKRARDEARKKRRATRKAKSAKRTKAKRAKTKKRKRKARKARASKKRIKRSRRKKSAKKAPKIRPFLNGVGSDYGRKTEWGLVETVDAQTAARIREMINGAQRTYDQPVAFEPFRARLTPDMTGLLAAISDYVKNSKDIMLVMIEGHAQDFEQPAKDHALSEARASAVREFLVQRGVDANRTIAYGLGRKQPVVAESEANRRVLLHLVSGTAIVRPPAQTWDQLAVARVSDGQQLSVRQAVDKEWAPIVAGVQLGAPAWLRTGAGTDVVLRAPDASRYQLGPNTNIALEKAVFRSNVSAVNMTLEQGNLQIVNDPTDAGRGQMVLKVAGASVAARSADITAQSLGQRQGWVAVTQGVATVTLSTGMSFKIGAGQTLYLDGDQPSIWAQLKAPVVTGPTHGDFLKIPTLSWQPVPGAVAYRVDIARDIDFHTVVARHSVTASTLEIDDTTEAGKKFFWRVAAIDERSTPGRLSQTFRLGKTPPKPSAEESNTAEEEDEAN